MEYKSSDSSIYNDAARQFGKSKSIDRIKIKVDEERMLRIVKSPSASTWFIVRKQHWGIPPTAAKPIPYICAKGHRHEPCFFCAQVNEFYNSGDPRLATQAARMKANSTVICNVIDVQDPVAEDGSPKVQVWHLTWNLFTTLKEYFTDPDYGDIVHPYEGRDIKVTCKQVSSSGDKKWRKYIPKVRLKATELVVDYEAVVEKLHDLEELYPIKVYTWAEQQQIFNGELDPKVDSLPSGTARKALPEATNVDELAKAYHDPSEKPDPSFDPGRPFKGIEDAVDDSNEFFPEKDEFGSKSTSEVASGEVDDEWDDLMDDDEKLEHIKKKLKKTASGSK